MTNKNADVIGNVSVTYLIDPMQKWNVIIVIFSKGEDGK